MEKRRRKVIHWLIESFCEGQGGDGGREVVYWMVERMRKTKRGEVGRKVVSIIVGFQG